MTERQTDPEISSSQFTGSEGYVNLRRRAAQFAGWSDRKLGPATVLLTFPVLIAIMSMAILESVSNEKGLGKVRNLGKYL
ncbi:hypothetical protein A2697_04080 [Candidatus Curtissbacteria bacterium RIFCSPHIGHO2_01_FULL_41_44]|uniref:Uncharacterized protein n=1 Tax=Candidatus Curtissbacteria bacterium RIFCSPLOWO2_01_FULL_42_50 TaxID=1797730 RepID=A0A1F5H359_9BACT|nr:MAG: hypothetical protein A2697_04080 [Candidatus Curtissbacteria bacterium RIFCSPHIGHO2_01_FULL_41_44]OGD92893.1 MAG: hypothetical protein A3C33_02180 [Candidatus Curtissbacteria bacterium RIFCSPHIGHO2_02_FULL_42_58]OGD96625.1 MAG: hypothetical protein A3E71_00670 [Candidatus Curtissbacteria bacterium RIFCSPHIGHO2_12_FULL_42_33]OGD98531.1 MAG: hypothetical protein A3B54_00320 [Candidatus Curtissbacteria bacterium RIFCSPLOWO2_01_FULL_42_50]OGE02874.1 MAG: hypothetical protein A3G16_04265 [Ca